MLKTTRMPRVDGVMLSSKAFTAIITHGDLDGLASAAIVVAHLMHINPHLKYRVYFSQPFSLHLTLSRVDLQALQKLYILDIAVDVEHWITVSQVLSELSKRLEVVWVDHHPSTISKRADLEAIGVKVTAEQAPATATLLREMVNETEDPVFYEKLVRLAEISDAPAAPDDAELASAVEVLSGSLALEPQDEDFKRLLIGYWVKKRVLVPEEAVERFEAAEEKARRLYEEATNRVVYDSPLLRVIDLRETRVYGFAGRIASHQAKVEGKIVLLMFRIGSDSVVITGRAPEEASVDLLEVFAKVAREWGGSGGGHPHAASIRLPAGLADKVLDRIISELEASLSKRAL
ncbi:MAG: hypothetical protein B7L53_02135 [Thermofilum sp. NZ13]|nr:MAG: hypothetical protein B7L53_02135 [Thermofilum sp. NZ13]